MQEINKYDVLLLDAANTIIHKPDLWKSFLTVLKKHKIIVDELELRQKHKLLSEIIHFPDRTSGEFYKIFNYELLLSLGIIGTNQLLNDIFNSCSYLAWQPFEDSFILNNLNIKKVIASNFNSSIKSKLINIFGDKMFDAVIGSEEEGIGKPDIKFYMRILEILNVKPDRILYVGDSLKLDIIPAQAIGIDAWLIDRDKNFTHFNKRIDSLKDLERLI